MKPFKHSQLLCIFIIFFSECSSPKEDQKNIDLTSYRPFAHSSTVTIVGKTALGTIPVPRDNLNISPGMILLSGGMTVIGSNSELPQEKLTFEVRVKAFLMDKSPVRKLDLRNLCGQPGT